MKQKTRRIKAWAIVDRKTGEFVIACPTRALARKSTWNAESVRECEVILKDKR